MERTQPPGTARDPTPSRAPPPPPPEPETLARHLRFLADHLGPRPIGSEEAQQARRYLAGVITGIGFPVERQPFSVTGCVAGRSLVKLPRRVIPSRPVVGSPSTDGRARAPVRPLGSGEETPEASLWGVIALCALKRGDEEARAVVAAGRRRAVAAILYREEVPELYSATVASGTAPIPCVTIRSADGWQLAENTPEIELRVDATPSRLPGENLLVELGEGTRPLLFLAHYDTRPGTPGAFRNASGVTVLLGLLARLRGWEADPLIVGFLEGDELDGAGSRHCRDVLMALGVLTRLRGVVYVSGVGLSGLAVCAKESPRPSSLADVVERAVAEEGLLPVPAELASAGPTSVPDWRCATVTLAGPLLPAQHTGLDRPDLVSPRLLARTVSALERVVRSAGSLR